MTVSQISPNAIWVYKNKRRKEGPAPKTINNELILMGHAFSLAIKEWEWVRDNPVRKVSKEKVDNLIERWLTTTEEEILLSFSPSWLGQIIAFAINTGLRESEILDLHHYPESLRAGVEVLDKIPASDPQKETPVTIQSHANKKGVALTMQPPVITGSGAWI